VNAVLDLKMRGSKVSHIENLMLVFVTSGSCFSFYASVLCGRFYVLGQVRLDVRKRYDIGRSFRKQFVDWINLAQDWNGRFMCKGLRILLYIVTVYIHFMYYCNQNQSKQLHGLKRGSAAARFLGLRVRIPPGNGCLGCECCVMSGRGLCDVVITRPEESFRMWCV
jgi:hypothetical protein